MHSHRKTPQLSDQTCKYEYLHLVLRKYTVRSTNPHLYHMPPSIPLTLSLSVSQPSRLIASLLILHSRTFQTLQPALHLQRRWGACEYLCYNMS